jgi:ATP-dependent Lhr-like helicase
MDIDTFESLLRRLESGAIRVVAKDLTEPSPLALEALSARPYAYLDDAPLEERRTQAVMSRRWLDPAEASEIGKLDPDAIARVRAEAWPDAGTPDELHDALLWLTFMTDEEVRSNPSWGALLQNLAAQGRAAPMTLANRGLWVATERRALFQPQADGRLRDEALVDIVRGRLEGLGPVTVLKIADSLGVPEAHINTALGALEGEGFAMRGRFTPGASQEEWCERRLLARIHRYTVKRLRAEIEPVPARDFLRFLCEWQRVLPGARMQGSDALAAVLAQLEGFESPAGAWETEVIPLRIAEYEPQWLDEHCRAGRYVWTRLAARSGARGDEIAVRVASPVRSTPIVLLGRRNVALWSMLADPSEPKHLTSKAQAVRDFIAEQGASFFDEITESVRMLPAEVEDALAELVAVGLVNSDSFAGLRVLLMPSGRRGRSTSYVGRHKRRLALFGMADAGRWALVRRSAAGAERKDEAVEHVVRTLLRRWGVIFWKLLTREAEWLPPWRDLLSCCRRLEARGEIRGGRFVAGFSGEQFATPEAVGLLRDTRRKPLSEQYIAISAADPLNLLGILTPGSRLPSLAGNRLLLRDGLPVATLVSGEVRYTEELAPNEHWAAHTALLRRHAPAALDDLEPPASPSSLPAT